jgi:hypothetical protein
MQEIIHEHSGTGGMSMNKKEEKSTGRKSRKPGPRIKNKNT